MDKFKIKNMKCLLFVVVFTIFSCKNEKIDIGKVSYFIDGIPLEVIKNTSFFKNSINNCIEYGISDYGLKCGSFYVKTDAKKDSVIYIQLPNKAKDFCNLNIEKFYLQKKYDIGLKRYALRCDNDGNIFFYYKNLEEPLLIKAYYVDKSFDLNNYVQIRDDWYLNKSKLMYLKSDF